MKRTKSHESVGACAFTQQKCPAPTSRTFAGFKGLARSRVTERLSIQLYQSLMGIQLSAESYGYGNVLDAIRERPAHYESYGKVIRRNCDNLPQKPKQSSRVESRVVLRISKWLCLAAWRAEFIRLTFIKSTLSKWRLSPQDD